MSNSLNFTMDLGDITTLGKNLGLERAEAIARIETALNLAAIATQGIARSQAPTRTGRLVNSIGYKIRGLTAVISPNVTYAGYVEMGTGIYGVNHQNITPKNSKVFATKVNPGFGSASKSGYFIIGRSSKGQKPNPFMERSAALAKPIVEGYFKTTLRNFSKEFSK